MRSQLANGAAALVLAALCALAPPQARAEDLTVGLAVGEAGFAPAEIRVPPRTRVRIEITNRTRQPIEFESFALNRERVIPPGQTAAVYVSGLSPGRYDFFDDFHRQRHGTLVVE